MKVYDSTERGIWVLKLLFFFSNLKKLVISYILLNLNYKNVKIIFRKAIQAGYRALSPESNAMNLKPLTKIVFEMKWFEIEKICI